MIITQQLDAFLRKYSVGIQVGLLLVAVYFLSLDITRPLANYDEATYAKVAVDTLTSGDMWSFTLSGSAWYEKPPLYLWLAMGSIKLFGVHEFAFRIPSILASLVCLWLTYVIVRRLTGSELASIYAFLILLSAPLFYYNAKEVRLDSSVIAAILAAFWYWLKGLQNEKYLLVVFPLAAVGFLFKSIIVLLLGPILLIYSLLYRRWAWSTNIYLWMGALVAACLLVPWHVVQWSRFGNNFIDRYFWFDVYSRATTTVTGGSNHTYFFTYLWVYSPLWAGALIGAIALFLYISCIQDVRVSFEWKSLAASFCVMLLILVLFSAAGTHLSPYLLPAYPYMAIFVGLLVHTISKSFGKYSYVPFFIVSLLVTSGAYYSSSQTYAAVLQDVPDEAAIGRLFKEQHINSAPLYSLDWKILETINYYSGTKTQPLNAVDMSGKELKGPLYLVTTIPGASYFFSVKNGTFDSKNGVLISTYPNLHTVYFGSNLVLLYFDSDIRLPEFVVRQ